MYELMPRYVLKKYYKYYYNILTGRLMYVELYYEFQIEGKKKHKFTYAPTPNSRFMSYCFMECFGSLLT